MDSSYVLTGRARQKQRTRDALVAATRALIKAGTAPTVEQAAYAAGVSRPTAYRYFHNQRALLVAARPELDALSLLADPQAGDPRERLGEVVETITSWVVEWEAELRTALRLSLDPGAPEDPLRMRAGRAVGWIVDALSPLSDRMVPEELERLAMAIRSAIGIEAFVWLVDVAGRTPEQAQAITRWSAMALYDSAVGRLGAPPEAS
jgi:AcrR family transcriptional regulator